MPQRFSRPITPEDTAATCRSEGYTSVQDSTLQHESSTSSVPRRRNPGDLIADGKRKLLLIYVHGFHGTATSFQNFPAHVHSLVSITLSETHVVRTKVYPRYRSRRSIGDVAQDLSRWLEPNESDDTDVILLGHSMGGLLAAETAMLLADRPTEGHPFRHHIIGTINFDVPFLGVHPVIIGSGIASIFRPAKPSVMAPGPRTNSYASDSSLSLDAQSSTTSSGPLPPLGTDTLFQQPDDGNFNPTFVNDPNLSFRKGWRNILHFATKHADNLRTATMQLVDSHAEFGGAMADYCELYARYNYIRGLEDVDEGTRTKRFGKRFTPPRIRFVNYYTASTGRRNISNGRSWLQLRPPQDHTQSESPASSADASFEKNADVSSMRFDGRPQSSGVSDDEQSHERPAHHDTTVIDADRAYLQRAEHINDSAGPGEPDGFRKAARGPAASSRLDFSGRKLSLVANQNHVERTSGITLGLNSNLQKSARLQELDINSSTSENRNIPGDLTERLKQVSGTDADTSSNPSAASSAVPKNHRTSSEYSRSASKVKPRKDRKFCNVPGKIDGKLDPAWVRVHIAGVDEITAHCSLFDASIGETYEMLVGDVGGRIETWVGSEMARPLVDEPDT